LYNLIKIDISISLAGIYNLKESLINNIFLKEFEFGKIFSIQFKENEIQKCEEIIENFLKYNYTLKKIELSFKSPIIENILFRNKFLTNFVFFNFNSNFDLIFCFDLNFFNKRKIFH
jgi:hypothetical protein